MKFMPGILLIGLCLFAGCASLGQFSSVKPLSDRPYIVVYGRADCSACEDAKKGLEEAGADYTYKDMENGNVRSEVYARLREAGLGSEKFLIPVIDVNGNLASRPALEDVLERFDRPLYGKGVSLSAVPADVCGEAGSDLSSCAEQVR